MHSAASGGVGAPTRIDIDDSDHVVQTDMSASSNRLMRKLATTATWRDDDDMKGSDSSQLHSDASTASSRMTTPNPQPPPISRPSLSSTIETHTPHVSRTPAIPIPGALPPPPPPPRRGEPRYFQRSNQPRQVPEFPSNLTPGSNIDGFRRDQALQAPPPHGFPAPLTSLAGKFNADDRGILLPTMHRDSHQPLESSSDAMFPQYPLPNTSRSTGSPLQPEASVYSGLGHKKTVRLMSGLETRSERSSSENSFEADALAYRNARHFPPQLPAQPNHLSNRQQRSSATNRITNWVSEYEKSYIPARVRRHETYMEAPSDHSESGDGRSQSSAVSSRNVFLEHSWQKFQQKRAEVKKLKHYTTTIRQEQRNLRRRMDDAGNAFVAVLRPLLVSQRSEILSSSLEDLDRRWAAMLRLREEYHSREATYESLELELDKEEQELDRLETKFYSLFTPGRDGHAKQSLPTRSSTNDTIQSTDSETPYCLLGICADKSLEDVHPLYHKFSAAVGDLQNAKEEYEDLLTAKVQYEEDTLVREQTGRPMTLEAEEFFADLSDEKARMQSSIKELESQVQRLRQQCEEQGAMKKFLSVQMSYILNPETTRKGMYLEDDANILQKHKTVIHPRYSELLTQHSHLLDGPVPLTAKQALTAACELPDSDPLKSQKKHIAEKEYAIEALVQSYNSESKADLINRWVLQQLGQSPLNALLLQSVFGSECGLKIRDYLHWQLDVLHYWSRDGTMSPAAEMDKSSVSEMSEYSDCTGSLRRSRAASDGELHLKPMRKTLRQVKSSDTLRFNGQALA
ncbi:uncharacterized protein MAM_01315 [Metarhizium album ARSEF 1941]|uniref:Uncharacterized protein n=1 Tax=Metarhizium album (strain ARSEF 1941) TaxID=1081103 RepID=A0A0B2WWE7_METAS|nr:uncharacterized protein MAM_01315 [Metarhizium album ARSEF 1941]KHO00537.1 hypothetical protein MAM_01315 [Metarhizium album ARSEF 1941]